MIRRITARGGPAGTRAHLSCDHEVELPVPAGDADIADCRQCDERHRPDGLRAGRRTPDFRAATTPPALRAAHRTTAWAELVVTAGRVEFRDEHPARPLTTVASPGQLVTIVPDVPHEVQPSDDAEFHVQFYDPAPADVSLRPARTEP